MLDRGGISTKKQIITLSVWDIKKYTNLSINDILFVKNIVSNSVCPNVVTGSILKSENSCGHTHVSTGCNVIDGVLKGGFRRGTLTEIYGESGCGKTQLSLQVALNNWRDGCLFICTEDLFPVKRFEELKRALPTFDSDIDYGKNVFVEHITEASELLACIRLRLPKLLVKHKLSIVIIDSIAAPFRCESTNYIKRAEELREIAIILTEIAQKHNLAILCINQVTASFDESNTLLPSLGLAWSNMISTRIMIKKTMTVIDKKNQHNCYMRELLVMFAPDLSNMVTEFVITSRGIQPINFSK
ncbi:unnamed protein product [Arctia plantaginis]|uniref:RecA family profile 1 domain-containing protein n=1 Tax=Arctia plantaginis TaxID=874455 RepID=A0A8S0ZS90_ARCPL|nr:unnamed protein product [Arctia plantaginis]CAB3237446.1 unnamed protein product [Arctia plantaginis]